jgi:hypothetical protein
MNQIAIEVAVCVGVALVTTERLGKRSGWGSLAAKSKRLTRTDILIFSPKSLQFAVAADRCRLNREGSGVGKVCVRPSITMAETLAELIISEVKSRQILWDVKHPSYHNRKLVDKEWRNIAENVGETSKFFHKCYYRLALV